ncbi:cysteine desulfurase NifS [bacterium (Candidatus Gribaldobacteria) CG_4_10_14_0_2_um_filter_41_16]|uniref:cysteine desulfurase n=1 Tax=bacterium (Candidatus Gribaldobacteria) CG_4_10_14_0_2_um_filter_41_16 TaxID=2014265 RepID=A0A2M7VIN6_9BACT|nr:MAG: cysteine desulfurase NifS [Parcubacteria group bacterium CG1_02_41_26]PJA01663.1 MAG: cysteine desulfurase NifS [bacterium (Candidatus Gribaldobacteria) CG_4_10_14_0_2_um_filter_41_16]
MKQVYLDYAATTPQSPEATKAMRPYFEKHYGNASSLHQFGQRAREAVEASRQNIAKFLNCSMAEVFFTGSATEADNLAILGVIKSSKLHIITTAIEHPAVLEPIKRLEKLGEIEVTYLPVSRDGLVKVEDIEKAIRPNTVLVSIMYANNEIGVIQPIVEIGKVIKATDQKIIFHTDAVQAANYLDCDVQKLGVDLLTLSGHKIYGPKGVGALYVKKGAALEPIMFGGHQEQGLRPSTENVAAIAGLGAAIATISNRKSQIANIKKLRDKLLDGILKNIPKTSLNGSADNRLPNNVNISFSGVEGESILMALDQKGVCVSTGSACASGSLQPSHVLMALGLSHQQAHGSIRFSLGKYTTKEEIDYVLKVLPDIIKRLRAISPIK